MFENPARYSGKYMRTHKHTEPYQGGPDGIPVQWVFEGISDLVPIYEPLQDGAEIL